MNRRKGRDQRVRFRRVQRSDWPGVQRRVQSRMRLLIQDAVMSRPFEDARVGVASQSSADVDNRIVILCGDAKIAASPEAEVDDLIGPLASARWLAAAGIPSRS